MPASKAKCTNCGKPMVTEYRPFCSKRCADIDLGKWMTGQYAIPSEDPDEAEELLEELEQAAEKADKKLH
ncbi:MAG: DNA gyrase inhibitor YacG [Pseudomonadota bacterium]